MKTKLKEWKEVEKELFTPEEIEASNFRVAIIGELIKARNEKRISQRLISKIEKCLFTPQLDTLLNTLFSLGFTLELKKLKPDKN